MSERDLYPRSLGRQCCCTIPENEAPATPGGAPPCPSSCTPLRSVMIELYAYPPPLHYGGHICTITNSTTLRCGVGAGRCPPRALANTSIAHVPYPRCIVRLHERNFIGLRSQAGFNQPDIPGGLVFGSAPGFTWFFRLLLVSPGFSWFCSWFQNQEPHAVAPGFAPGFPPCSWF